MTAPDAPAAKSSRRRKALRRMFAAIALAFGLSIALVSVEVFLRTTDPIGLAYEGETLRYFQVAVDRLFERPPHDEAALDGRLFRHLPSIDVSLGSFHVRTNALRCRGPEIREKKPDGVFRIVLLGDSVAFGWGVEDEVTFARRLEREWNAQGHATRLEVVNTAMPKYDTNQEEATLRDLGLRLQPDLVLLVYVTNDLSDPTRDTIEQLLTGKHPHPDEQVELPDDLWSWLAKELAPALPATAKLIGTRSDDATRVAKVLPAGVRYTPETFGAGPRGWARSQAALLRIAAMCKDAGVPLVLFDHTLPRVESLEPFCKENDIAYEPFWFTDEDRNGDITNSWLDSHANAAGHELLLGRLRAALERRQLLPRD
ncbi:MAG: SGNH/GDSL hydrolase family protein [Planctomycetes bacterium]|nr:SGNH/GDSL hydrolase family protein [Planctomycetota bacterium]